MSAAMLLAQAGPANPGPLHDVLGAVGGFLHWMLHLPPQASSIAGDIDSLQYIEITTMWALGAVMGLIALFFAIRYSRGRRTDRPDGPPRKITSPLWLEVGVGTVLLSLFFFYWVIGFRQYVDTRQVPDDALEVYVTGKQWVWKFAYADGPASAGVLYLPVDRPARLMLTSRDVIHSFFVPAFRLKQDALPGRFTQLTVTPTETGRFDIMCAEFCGAGHSRMMGEVVVLPQEQFAAWLADEPPERGPDAVTGTPITTVPDTGGVGAGVAERLRMRQRGFEAAAANGCFQCHSSDGSPHLGPTWLGLYDSWVRLESGDSARATTAYLTESMMDPMRRIVAGFQPIMPSYQGRLQPGDVAAILEYIKSLEDGQPEVQP